MKRIIRITKETQIEATLPSEECQSCAAVFGETRQFLGSLKRKDLTGTIPAEVSCRARPKNRRHLNIRLTDQGIDADSSVRRWISRDVHCHLNK